MKQLFVIFCLCISTICFGNIYVDNAPIEPAPSECTATLTPSDCYSSSSDIIECYNVKWSGGSETYFIYVKRVPYGVESGYAISYAQTGKRGLVPHDKAFATKKEAISHFVKSVIGSSCRYVIE